MSDISEIVSAEFEALKNELIAKYDEMGMRASGNWAETLEVEISGSSAEIVQADYGTHLEHGRKPGKQPPTAAIEQWIKEKGIAARLEKGITISSLAFLIARKIAKQGWNRNGYGGTGLVSKVVTPERIQAIIDKVSDAHLTQISNEIINYFKTAP